MEGDIEDAYLLSHLADQQMHYPDLVGETEDGSEDPIGQEISSQTLAEGLAQDSDWNAGSLGGEEPEEAIPAGEEFAARGTEELKENLAPFKNNLNTLRQMIAEIQEDNYGNEGNLEDAIKAWEEKLNSIGDDAELADVDLQGILEEQQELINTLSNMGEVQRDTAEAVIKKTSAGLSSPAEASETGEEGEGQIIIPAGNSQIDFSGIVGQVSKIDSFTWKLSVSKDEVGDFRIPSLHKAEIEPLPGRTASGDHHQIPGDTADLSLTEDEDQPAYDPDLKPEKIGETGSSTISSTIDQVAGIATTMAETAASELEDIADDQADRQEMKESTREEQQILEDELSDWPDGETREITYSDWEKQADGTYVKVEKTVTLTKEEAESLRDRLETRVDEADSRNSSVGSESPYQLVEGNILVGEADISDLVLENGGEPGESDLSDGRRTEELNIKVDNY